MLALLFVSNSFLAHNDFCYCFGFTVHVICHLELTDRRDGVMVSML
jgi:hypothetical protein